MNLVRPISVENILGGYMKNLLYTVALAMLTVGCAGKQKDVKTFKDEKIMDTTVPGWALNPKPG